LEEKNVTAALSPTADKELNEENIEQTSIPNEPDIATATNENTDQDDQFPKIPSLKDLKPAKSEKKKVTWKEKIITLVTPDHPEFDTPRRLVSLIYFQAIMWLCLPFIPFAVVVCAVVNLLLFKYQKFFLFRLMKKPKQAFSAIETGVFFILLYIITFSFALITYYYMINVNDYQDSNCSLVSTNNSDNTMLGVVRDMINSGPYSLRMVYEHIFANSILVWLIVAVMFGIYYSRDQTTKALRHYTNMLRDRMTKEQKTFEDKLSKQRSEIQLLQKRLNFLKHD
jgi:hypothetical protein